MLPYKTLPVSPVFKKNINWNGVVTGYKKAGYFFRRESELRFNMFFNSIRSRFIPYLSVHILYFSSFSLFKFL